MLVVTGLLGLTAAFAAANPVAIPQLFDFDVLDDIPAAPSPNIAIGAASQIVTYDAASMIAAATVAPLNTPTPSAAQAAKVKRDDIPLATCYGGTPQPTGAGPIPSPDTPEAFAAYASFAAIANAAITPPGYVQTFRNYNASAIALGYLGYTTFQTYDVNGCAAKCSSITNCHAFDIYFERDPSVDPGTGLYCNNPNSTTQIKCAFWGGPITLSNAVNYGQYRKDFHVVIAGSNGYVSNNVDIPAGYTDPYYAGNASTNAPLDCNQQDTYLGFKLFNDAAPFSIQRCAAACTAQTEYNVAHPPEYPAKPEACTFFDTYILNKNGVPQGQYCALYSQSWTPAELTNTGQYDNSGNHYTISYSYTSSNASNPGTCTQGLIHGGHTCPPGIRPGVCSTSYNEYTPGCFCGYDIEGETVAFEDGLCDPGLHCASNADCRTGSICLAATCCGFSQCIKSSSCPNTIVPKMLFARAANETVGHGLTAAGRVW